MSREPAADHFDTRKPELSPQAAAVLKRLREAARQQRLENEARARGETPAKKAKTGIRHLDPAHDDGARDAQDVFFPRAPKKTQKRYSILIMVFVFSAAITGAVGGLLLSMRETAPKNATMPHGTTIVRRQASLNSFLPAAKPVKKPVKRRTVMAKTGSSTVIVKKTSPRKPRREQILPPPPPLTQARAAAATPPAAIMAKKPEVSRVSSPAAKIPEKRVTAPARADEPASSAIKAVKALAAPVATPPTQASDAPLPPLAAPADDGGLKSLTDNVVAALKGLSGQAAPDKARTSDLRQALKTLVSKALRKGHSSREIAGLLDSAINKAGDSELPGALRGADGRIDTRQLIASVIPAEKAASSAGNAGGTLLAQLEKEARDTTIAPIAKTDTAAAASASRFFTRDGQRFTIIAPGDTLSGIAFAAYGDVLAYPRILRANAGRISVRNLKPGTRIVIPDKSGAAGAAPRSGAGRAVKHKTGAKRKASRQQARKRPAKAGRKKGQRKITDRLLGAITAPAAAGTAPATEKPVPVTNFKAAAPAQ